MPLPVRYSIMCDGWTLANIVGILFKRKSIEADSLAALIENLLTCSVKVLLIRGENIP